MENLTLNLQYTPAQLEIFFPKKETKFTIVPKGRRFGATKGASNAIIEWCADGITPILWVDTINANIERYFERYFEPELKAAGIKYNFNKHKHQLNLFDSIVDFRSADKPESIEGFGYKKIFLNEAGIILKDSYLYKNAILPMLLDYSDSQLYAIGAPKGRNLKNGKEHLFYTLYKRGNEGAEGYRCLTYSSYDNPLLNKTDIQDLENEMNVMDSATVRQEIYGEFTDASGDNPFFHLYDSQTHTGSHKLDPDKPLVLSIDFNMNPFACIAAHLWRDEQGEHVAVVDEIEIKKGSIPAMIDEIKLRYGHWLRGIRITGDASGNKGEITQRDNASNYQQLMRGLGLHHSQIVVPRVNPTHSNSRADSNYILKHFPDFTISASCKLTHFDMKNVQCDAFGSIIKRDRNDLTQRGDYADTVRYLFNTFLAKWVASHSKNNTFVKTKNNVTMQPVSGSRFTPSLFGHFDGR